MRLRGVLDDNLTMLAADRENRVHISRLPVEMYRQNGLRALCNHRLQLPDIHRIGRWVHIDIDRPRPGIVDCRDRRNEGERNGDDLVPRSDSGSQQGQLQRARATVHAHRVLHCAARRKLLFESRYFFAQNELARLENTSDGMLYFILYATVLGFQVEA